MKYFDGVFTLFSTSLPSLSIAVASILVLLGCHWIFIGRRSNLGSERKFPIQIFMLLLTLVCTLAFVIALPIHESSRNQIIGLIGILLSGMIAFSSANVIGNLMGGVLLRITQPFQTGDFIKVGDYFGRVSERGLFDTEVQSENRELISLPNAYLISNPVSTTRNSGAIVTATLSLGYDVHHLKIEPLLIKAAETSGLESPFVHILELGDFSVSYRVSGLLVEVKGLLTARSNLFKAILEALHNDGIEILSPTYMGQRKVGENQKIIPSFARVSKDEETVGAEGIVFDKAEQAAQDEKQKKELTEEVKSLEADLKNLQGDEKNQIKEKIKDKRQLLDELQQSTVVASSDVINTKETDS